MRRILAILLLAVLCHPLMAQGEGIKYWKFSIKGDSGVPCRFNEYSRELFLAGFDVLGADNFYFAGGKPLELACFKGEEKAFRLRLDDKEPSFAMMKAEGDSIYLFNNSDLTLYRVHRGGNGPVSKTTLSFEHFTPHDGIITNGEMVLAQKRDHIILNNSNVVSPGYDFMHLNLAGKFKRWTWQGYDGPTGNPSGKPDIPDSYLYSAKQPKIEGFKGHYKGEWNGYRVFWGDLDYAWAVILTDREGNVKKQYTMKYATGEKFKTIPFPVYTGMKDEWHFYKSPKHCILRQQYLYTAGYTREDAQIIVARLDLAALFPDAGVLKTAPQAWISFGGRKIWTGPDKLPEFPGGIQAMHDYIRKYYKTPPYTPNVPERMRITVSFIIEKDGQPSNVHIRYHRDGWEAYEKEALRLVREMPRWKPGTVKGEKVATILNIPITISSLPPKNKEANKLPGKLI